MSSQYRNGRTQRKGYLFSYGTLLPQHAPREIASTVRRLRRVGQGLVRGRLYDLGDYPGAVLTRNGPLIRGLVFELPEDPEVLERLDQYENLTGRVPRPAYSFASGAWFSCRMAGKFIVGFTLTTALPVQRLLCPLVSIQRAEPNVRQAHVARRYPEQPPYRSSCVYWIAESFCVSVVTWA
jgi:gamma-glutamylcyclotransferase (GGCT)/AIG2-like uncharacterized protein YtfP